MIKLEKSQCPNILERKAAQWTEELIEHLEREESFPKTTRQHYAHSGVKDALKRESFGKCMYCESRIDHVSYEHVEHIKPKARDKYPELTFQWENLGLACQKCNMNKGDNFDEAIPFINPYDDEPTEHFVAVGYFIWHRPGDSRAELTERQIELNRPGLIEQRKERMDLLRQLADRCATQRSPALKAMLQDELHQEAKREKPYSFCSQAMVKVLGSPA